MVATIIKCNYKRGLYAFQREDEEYGYFELIDTNELEPGDVLLGDFESLGSTTVIEEDTGEEADIFIEDFCTLTMAIKMIQ